VTLSTVARAGDTSLGQVTGLGAANIDWDYHDTSAVNLRLGTGAGQVFVLGTGTTTNIFSNANATINVGNNSSTAGIQGALNLKNALGKDAVNINSQRVRPQLLHDGSALTLDEAIRRHKVKSKAGDVDLPGNFEQLTDEQKKQLNAFLRSL
jgi:hypothetical protein